MKVRTSEYEITEAMITFGGGFVSLLGRLIRAADQTNKRKLVEAFADYMHQYDDLAVLQAEKAAKGPQHAGDAIKPLSLGDCVSCDGYVLLESEKPHCPTCARLLREGKPL